MEATISELLKNSMNITLSVKLDDLRVILNEAIEKAISRTPKQELSKFQTPIQLAKLIGCKLTTVYQNHYNGLIPGARKVGGKLLFDTKIILEWIEEKSIPTKAEKIKALTDRGTK